MLHKTIPRKKDFHDPKQKQGISQLDNLFNAYIEDFSFLTEDIKKLHEAICFHYVLFHVFSLRRVSRQMLCVVIENKDLVAEKDTC